MRFVHEARGLLGTPWRHLGRSERALDCVGLILLAATRAGYRPMEVPVYPRENDPQLLLDQCRHHLDPKSGAPEVGDIVVMRLAREPRHFAIIGDYPGGFSLIHAYNRENGLGKVVEHRMDKTWSDRIYAQFRMKT